MRDRPGQAGSHPIDGSVRQPSCPQGLQRIPRVQSVGVVGAEHEGPVAEHGPVLGLSLSFNLLMSGLLFCGGVSP